MGVQNDISTIEGIVDGLDSNRVARESYTEEAFNTDDVDGVASFDVENEQNVPLATATDLNATVLDKGLQTQGASIPRPALNHFFGRVSYNLNKLVQYTKVFLATIRAAFAHNCCEYDPNAQYKQGDSCFTITYDGVRYSFKRYIRTSVSPTTIQGIATTDTTHWTQTYEEQSINALKLGGIEYSRFSCYDIVIDSDAKLAAWATSGTYAKVLIKAGTWTLASGGVDLTARGTKLVVGEPGSKVVFSSAEKGLYYTTPPTTNDYRMEGVTVECTGLGDSCAFYNCSSLTNCTGTCHGEASGSGFTDCANLINCYGNGISESFGLGFVSCTYLVHCTGTGSSYAFLDCHGFDFNCSGKSNNKENVHRKYFSGTTAEAAGGLVSVAHGLDYAKIIKIEGIVYSAANTIPFNRIEVDGSRTANVCAYVEPVNLNVTNSDTISPGYLSRPFAACIEYYE